MGEHGKLQGKHTSLMHSSMCSSWYFGLRVGVAVRVIWASGRRGCLRMERWEVSWVVAAPSNTLRPQEPHVPALVFPRRLPLHPLPLHPTRLPRTDADDSDAVVFFPPSGPAGFGTPLEHLVLGAVMAAPLLGAFLMGCGSVGLVYGYVFVFDFLRCMGYSNVEVFPVRLLQALPFLRYLIYSPT
ncbi:hypothetical protein BHE74_00033914 [Ensete ventricosum]|nr:hypothetical protein BHE74_00033914 [Ensete ventricosum]